MTFREWVEREGKDIAADTLGVTRQTVWAWMNAKVAPRVQDRDRLSRRTGRVVPVAEFALEALKEGKA